MKGFKLDSNGDLLIENGKIALIEGSELTAQTCKTVLGTNKGEWWLNSDEGIDFDYILGKGITEDMVRTQCQSGIRQVDQSLYIDSFNYSVEGRASITKFTAHGDSDAELSIEKNWN